MSKMLHSKSRNHLLKKIGLLVFAVCMVCMHSVNVKAETAGEYTIYGWDTIVPDEYIPAGYPKSCQLPKIDGQKTTYQIITGMGKVSEDGVVTSDYTAKTAINPLTGEYIQYGRAEESNVRIRAVSGNVTREYIVHIENGKKIYCEAVMDDYIKNNITKGMQDEEMLKVIARFPAQYDYSVNFQDAEDMVLFGGGDCWASTDATIKICEKLGIKAWERDGSGNLGAGSAHRNTMVELNGKYYELESGYGGTAPRPYDVTLRNSLFSYYKTPVLNSSTPAHEAVIYSYDGYDTTGNIDVPAEIDGYKVVELAYGALIYTRFTNINLPNTLETIGDRAFYSCGNLEKIIIPESVTSIGKNVFSFDEKLVDIEVENGNSKYKAIQNVIYSKDGTELVCCPNRREITIPASVKKIGKYAFSLNSNLTSIVIPENVVELDEGAFGECRRIKYITFDGNNLKKIGSKCFSSNMSLLSLNVPASVEEIGSYAFEKCGNMKCINFCGDAPSFGEIIKGNKTDEVFSGCNLIGRYLEGNNTWKDDVLTNHGGTVIWEAKKNFDTASIENATVSFDKEHYYYTENFIMNPIEPQVTVVLDGVELKENRDYHVRYSNNKKAGTADIVITGVGDYSGEIYKEFTIEKAQRNIGVSLSKKTLKISETSKVNVYNVSNAEKNSATYASEDETIAIVDAEGVITGVGAGETRIMVHVPETENYVAFDKAFDIKVTKSIENSTITTEKEKYSYTADYIVPQVTVVLDEVVLKENEDYKVTVTNNKYVGMADVEITGMNLYYGECLAQFEIEKSERTVEAKLSKSSVSTGEISKIEFEPMLSSEDGKYITYESKNPEIATVDAYGRVKGVNQGRANIIIHMPETANRLASDLNVTIEVIQSSNNNNSGSNNNDKDSNNKHDEDKFPVDVPQECNHEYVMEYKVEPTCLWDGCVGYSCIECGDIYEENIKALGHDFTSNGIYCSRCGAVNPDNYNVNNTPDINKKSQNKEMTDTYNMEKSSVTKCKAEKKGLRIYFKTNSKVDGYQIQCASNKKFTKKLKTVEVKNNKTKSVRVKNLKKKATYYVRIRTYKLVSSDGQVQKIYSEWSNCKKAKTK